MISMVLGFGLTTLSTGIGNLAQIRRRVKLYWLHSLWVGAGDRQPHHHSRAAGGAD
jgi:hypothetical protein